METSQSVPILIPVEPDLFWKQMRAIVREELQKIEKNENQKINKFQTNGLTYKPLYKIDEVCGFFQVTRPTIYDWIKDGKLKPYKIRSRVYFLYSDIKDLLKI